MTINIKVDKNKANDSTLSYEETRRIADFLEVSEEFESLYFETLYSLKIKTIHQPKSESEWSQVHQLIRQLDQTAFTSKCITIQKLLNFPDYLLDTVKILLITDELIPPKLESVQILSNLQLDNKKQEELNKLIKSQEVVVLVIRNKTSQPDLRKIITKDWSKIKKGMETIPSLSYARDTDIALLRRIEELVDHDGYDFQQISELLSNEYEDSSNAPSIIHDPNALGNAYRQWKKKINSLGLVAKKKNEYRS